MAEPQPKFCLVNMPWASPTEPALGAGILKSKLNQVGCESRVFNLNVSFLTELSYDTYRLLADEWALNDFVFSGMLDDQLDEAQLQSLFQICEDAYRRDKEWRKQNSSPGDLIDRILRVRNKAVPGFIERSCESILDYKPDVIGFTCAFDQTIASVALSDKLREQGCEVPIIFGGYAVDGKVGEHIISTFPAVDGIAMGDGEETIVQVVKALQSKESLGTVPNLLVKGGNLYQRKKISLETSPTPDYTDYFSDIEALYHAENVKISNNTLPVESSRGCWWGERSHCIFCGIDSDTLKYRTKSDELFLSQLVELRNRWGDKAFRMVDYIFPHAKEKTLLPKLARSGFDFDLATEIKANTKKQRFGAFIDAGFTEFQPGIESFSTEVLKGMRKGVSAAQNVLFLVLGRQHSATVHFNILFGFPFDRYESYREMVQALPSLYHLHPPNTCSQVFTTRYAPMQTAPDAHGVRSAEFAHSRYDVIFSRAFKNETGFDASRYCYYFETHRNDDPKTEWLYSILSIQAKHWQSRWSGDETPVLEVSDREDGLFFKDTRVEGRSKAFWLRGCEADLYRAVHHRVVPYHAMIASTQPNFDIEEADRAWATLVDRRLVFHESGQVVGLATGDIGIRQQPGFSPSAGQASEDANASDKRPRELDVESQ